MTSRSPSLASFQRTRSGSRSNQASNPTLTPLGYDSSYVPPPRGNAKGFRETGNWVNGVGGVGRAGAGSPTNAPSPAGSNTTRGQRQQIQPDWSSHQRPLSAGTADVKIKSKPIVLLAPRSKNSTNQEKGKGTPRRPRRVSDQVAKSSSSLSSTPSTVSLSPFSLVDRPAAAKGVRMSPLPTTKEEAMHQLSKLARHTQHLKQALESKTESLDNVIHKLNDLSNKNIELEADLGKAKTSHAQALVTIGTMGTEIERARADHQELVSETQGLKSTVKDTISKLKQKDRELALAKQTADEHLAQLRSLERSDIPQWAEKCKDLQQQLEQRETANKRTSELLQHVQREQEASKKLKAQTENRIRAFNKQLAEVQLEAENARKEASEAKQLRLHLLKEKETIIAESQAMARKARTTEVAFKKLQQEKVDNSSVLGERERLAKDKEVYKRELTLVREKLQEVTKAHQRLNDNQKELRANKTQHQEQLQQERDNALQAMQEKQQLQQALEESKEKALLAETKLQLPVRAKDILKALKADLGFTTLDVKQKLVVKEVSDEGSAGKAGVKKGDVIVEIDGTKLDNCEALEAYLKHLTPGTISLLLIRGDQGRGSPVPIEVEVGAKGLTMEETGAVFRISGLSETDLKFNLVRFRIGVTTIYRIPPDRRVRNFTPTSGSSTSGGGKAAPSNTIPRPQVASRPVQKRRGGHTSSLSSSGLKSCLKKTPKKGPKRRIGFGKDQIKLFTSDFPSGDDDDDGDGG